MDGQKITYTLIKHRLGDLFYRLVYVLAHSSTYSLDRRTLKYIIMLFQRVKTRWNMVITFA